jgi:Mn2+/Fe2+ NRAMP family transporter
MSDSNLRPVAQGGFKHAFSVRLAALWSFVALMGPGIITGSVDNDAGGIATYSLAGARYGLDTLWLMVPMTAILIVVQDMGARMAAVSGKGLSDLIRERYGVVCAFYLMIMLIAANLGTTLAEFAGIAAALEIFGVSKYLSVPLSVLALMWLVVKGSYRSVEKIFLVAILFFASYIVAGFLVRPDWMQVFRALGTPTIRMETPFIVMMVGLVGTTISPWMLFYLQASMVDKGIGLRDLGPARTDVVVGSIVVSIVASFIVLVCAFTLHKAGVEVEEAAQAALALEPVAGKYCSWLFAFGLFNASMLAASVLPLSTSYTVCEAFGWESSLNKKFSEAPQFYSLYCFMVFLSGAVILAPGLPLMPIMYVSQVFQGLALPILLVFMLLLMNDKAVMKDRTNGTAFNIAAWATVVLLFFLSGAMVVFTFLGQA